MLLERSVNVTTASENVLPYFIVLINEQHLNIFSAVLLMLLSVVTSLECWLCVADDCSRSPSANHRTRIITCETDASCQVNCTSEPLPLKELNVTV